MRVSIIMGSRSDLTVVEPARITLHELGIKSEDSVLSAHRNPATLVEYVKSAPERGIKVFIAAAGKAAHLPGVIAAYTILPVIGIPIKTSDLGGMDSLLSIVQMPRGVPVATVAINGSQNAAILAAQILALSDEKIKAKLENYKKEMSEALGTDIAKKGSAYEEPMVDG